MSDDNVITLDPSKPPIEVDGEPDPRSPLMRRTFHAGHNHTHFILNEKEGSVYCRDCETRVDAFAVLNRLALFWGSAEHELNRLRAESKRAREDLVELKRERRNLRAQVKRLCGKLP